MFFIILISLNVGGDRIKQRKTYHILTGLIMLVILSILVIQYTIPGYKALKTTLWLVVIILAIFQMILERKNKKP